jgi:hypothetical protein
MSFDKSMLEANVRAIAAQFPDRIYRQSKKAGSGPSCFYVRNGKPDCLIAQGAFMAGMDIDTLASFDAVSDGAVENSGAEYVFKPYGLTAVELDWLKRVQQLQDDGFPWGKAVQMADEGELIPWKK